MLQAIDRPEDVGVDASRLSRIHDFLAATYVGTRFPATSIVVSRGGQVVYVDHQGYAPDAIVRLYSMTKAITSVGLMTLYEEGRVQLDEPVSHFLPAWADLRVWASGTPDRYSTKTAEREMTVRDLLTHCSGLTYDFLSDHPLTELYKRRKLNGLPGGTLTLAEFVDDLGTLPLQFSPGTQWNYSVSTDVCGRLCEVISGQSLDTFLTERVLGPLDMVDTAFSVAPHNASRFVANYAFASRDRPMVQIDTAETSPFLTPPTFLSGGGGLTGTLADYHRFAQMLLRGGELDGRRVLGRKTVQYMTSNHLPSGGDLASMGRETFNEAIMTGMGFGLGFSVIIDPSRTQVISSKGEFAWGGAASTYFWVDPAEELTVVFLTQLVPSAAWPVRRELRQVVYQALT